MTLRNYTENPREYYYQFRDSVPDPMRVLCLGGGVQSTTLAYMAVTGEIHLDLAVFADPQWESAGTYANLLAARTALEKAGIPCMFRSRGSLPQDLVHSATSGARISQPPLFTRDVDGTRGMLRRACTRDYKVRVIERTIRRIAKVRATLLLGITVDEAQRMKPNPRGWATNEYPLIDMDFSRADCVRWLMEHGYKVPPPSSCLGCPYHSDSEWRRLSVDDPDRFADACRVDAAIRTGIAGTHADLYLHRSCSPLKEAIDRMDQQAELFDECGGYCHT